MTMVTGVLGTIIAMAFSILLLIPIRGLECSLGMESYICLVMWVIIGFLFYNRRR